MALKIRNIERNINEVIDFINKHIEQLGFILPLPKEKILKYFPLENSYLILLEDKIMGVFSYILGREKTAPTGYFRLITERAEYLEGILSFIIKKAVANEKLFLRTAIYGYKKNIMSNLIAHDSKVAAEIPEMVSFDGKLYSRIVLYVDLRDKYKFDVTRLYKSEELYPVKDVEKVDEYSFKVRGLRYQDLSIFEEIFNQNNVYRTMGSGVFEGLQYINREIIWQNVLRKKLYTLTCIDEKKGIPIGFLSLSLYDEDVLKGVANLGMLVDERYHGLGAGSLLMEKAILLAKRLHLRLLSLSVFNVNPAGIRLYKKFGFVEHGRYPGWFQNGYIEEIFMSKKLS